MRPTYFVPETKPVGALFAELQASNTHMAVVVDEYGGTAGIATIELLLEESNGLEEHQLAQARRQVLAAARHLLTERLSGSSGDKRLEELVRAVAARKMDPRSAAERLVGRTDG